MYIGRIIIFVIFLFIIAIGVGYASTSSIENGSVSSSFDSGNEGWQVVGDAQGGSAVPTHHSKGGVNNSGFISADDDVAGGTWYWSAPSEFLGDKSEFYGESLSFYLNQSSTTSQFNNNDIIIEGENGENNTLIYDFGNESSHPGINWTHYQVQLDETDNWKIQKSGETPSQSKFKSIISNISRIWIRGEYVTGSDTGGLDHVVLTGQKTETQQGFTMILTIFSLLTSYIVGYRLYKQ